MPLKIRYVPLGELVAYDKNPKAHRVDVIVDAIRRFGFMDPVIIDERTGRLAAGHGRLVALTGMRDADPDDTPDGIRTGDGDWLVPQVVGWRSANDREYEAALVALNRTTEAGGWDEPSLLGLLERLGEVDDGLVGVGFDDGEIAELRDRLAALTEPDATEPAHVEPPADPTSKPGDIWQVGPHRIICGDAREPDIWSRLLADVDNVAVVFTSPPYAQQRDYDPDSGFVPIPPDDYVEWWEPLQANVREHLADNGSFFVNIKAHAEDGQRHLYVYDLVAAHVRRWGWLFVDDLCWVDTKNGVPGGWPNRFKDAWEPVFHFSQQREIKFRPLANGTMSDAVFDYSAETTTTATGSGLLGVKATAEREGVARPSNVVQIAAASTGGHSAAYPVGLPSWFVRAYSDKGDTIADPFAGSGTTIVAAHRTGRIGYGIEISPAYVDVIVSRLEAETGLDAKHAVTGELFADRDPQPAEE